MIPFNDGSQDDRDRLTDRGLLSFEDSQETGAEIDPDRRWQLTRSWRLPVFRRLLVAYAFNELAWSVGTLALSVLVYRRTGSALGATGFFLCSQVGPAVLSPGIVARLDWRAPRRVLPVLYALEAVLFGILAWLTSRFSVAPVLALTLLDGIVAISARALASAARAEILKPANLLHEGNALTNTAFSVCFMAGPLIGGAVVVAGGTIAALLVNCAFFAVMSVVLATGGLPGRAHERSPGSGRLRAAAAHARRDRALGILLVLQGVGLVFFTITVPVEVVFAQHTLHAGAAGYGALMSSWGAGAVAGSAAYARWRRRSAARLIALSSAALGAGFGLMALAPTLAIAMAGAAVGGAGNSVEWVAVRTWVQERTPEEWMALIMSLSESIAQLAPGLGIVAGGVITAVSGPRAALAVAAIGSLAFAGVVLGTLSSHAAAPAPAGAPAAASGDGAPAAGAGDGPPAAGTGAVGAGGTVGSGSGAVGAGGTVVTGSSAVGAGPPATGSEAGQESLV
jgi:predicted MFS family arabinose efflux permease